MSIFSRACRTLSQLQKVGPTLAFNTARAMSGSSSCGEKEYMKPNCKVAIVTGGASGIGFAIAKEILNKKAKHVVITDKDSKKGEKAVQELKESYGCDSASFKCMNVNNEAEFCETYQKTICEQGTVDILVNNAGILNDKHWEETLKTNLGGVIRGTLIAFKFMTKQPKGGVVINISSILGFDTFPYAPIFTSSKHGVVGLTKSMGAEEHFCKSGVRVVALCPGQTCTDSDVLENIKKNQLSECLGQKTLDALKALPQQTTDVCGKSALHLIRYAEPGSLWVIEKSVLYKINLPERCSYQEKIKDFSC